jgi:hypothetical protein
MCTGAWLRATRLIMARTCSIAGAEQARPAQGGGGCLVDAVQLNGTAHELA